MGDEGKNLHRLEDKAYHGEIDVWCSWGIDGAVRICTAFWVFRV